MARRNSQPDKQVPANIRDIAEQAGVSVATVSRVLSGKAGAGEETIKRIESIAEELGYRPNLVARSLAKRQTGNIGVISPRGGNVVFGNPFFSTILEGVSDVLEKAGYNQVLSFTESQQKRLLDTRSVDGLLLFAIRVGDPVIEWVESSGLPAVVVGSYLEDSPHPSVRPNDEEGIRQAVRYLAERGHSRISLVTGPVTSVKSVRCIDGYYRGMDEAGLEVEEKWTIEAPEYTVTASFEELDSRLCEGSFDSTALVCASDYLALGALKATRVNDISVPHDISLVGFGNIPLSEFFEPALTTMNLELAEMGSQAARMLRSLIKTGKTRNKEKVFPLSLVERDSVRSL